MIYQCYTISIYYVKSFLCFLYYIKTRFPLPLLLYIVSYLLLTGGYKGGDRGGASRSPDERRKEEGQLSCLAYSLMSIVVLSLNFDAL